MKFNRNYALELVVRD